jgi:hypothetical protein
MRTFALGLLAVCAIGVLATALALGAAAAGAGSGGTALPIPVIVELFTSEGCSSCPPADDVLTKLVTTQPIPGAQVIALGEHVDYWDRLGWRDPFSSAQFSKRQSDYVAGVFHLGGAYTPQMVVDGREEFVGSDYRAATAAIAKAIHEDVARVRVSLALLQPTDTSLLVAVRVESSVNGPKRVSPEVWLAVTEDGLQTHVQRGENGGRTLHHTAVVRTLTRLGLMTSASPTWSMSQSVPTAAGWTSHALQLVAFVQDPSTRQVLGAGVLKP